MEQPITENALPTQSRNGGTFSFLVLLAAAFVLLVVGLSVRGLWHSEGRWAEISRTMLNTGDYFHPRLGVEPYFDKPLLSYWIVCLSAVVTKALGLADGLNEFSVRLPSALAGIVAIASVVSIGRGLWSASAGRVAGWILLTTYGFLFWSRTATSEAQNMAVVVLALAWYWSRRERAGFGSFLAFYVIIFLGAMMKGLPAVILPVLAVFVDVVLNRRWASVLKISNFLALVAGLAIYFAPFLIASATATGDYSANGLALVVQENFKRYVDPFDHTGPVYLYLYYLPLLLLPWTPLFVAAIVHALARWREVDRNGRWLLISIAMMFVFFTVPGSRRGYYILPLVPLCSLFTAGFLVQVRTESAATARLHGFRTFWWFLAITGLFEMLAPVVVPLAREVIGSDVARVVLTAMPHELLTAMGIIGAASLILSAAMMITNWRLRGVLAWSRPAFAIATAVVVMGGFFGWQNGLLEPFRTEKAFVQQVAARTAEFAPEEFAFYHRGSANVYFYLNTPNSGQLLREPDEVREFFANPKRRVLFSERRYIPDIERYLTSSGSGSAFRLGPPDVVEALLPWEKTPDKQDWVAWFLKESSKGESPQAAKD